MPKTAQVDLEEALEFALRFAKHAGTIAREYYDPNIVFKPKDNNSPVTKADLVINRLLIEECAKRYPGTGVMGEEESTVDASEWLWVCDPIDGTIAYMLGAQASTFCLALVQDGQPVVGVVYDFWNERLYSAIKGRGARLNGKVLPNSETTPLRLVNLETFPGAPHNVGDLRDRLIARQWQAPNFASSAFMSMATATGRIAGVIYTGEYAWDIAAAKVIVEELGCRVTDLDGGEQRYDGKIKGGIVTHPAHDQELRALIREAR